MERSMKLTVGTSLPPRLHRKAIKSFGTKRPVVTQPRALSVPGREEQRPTLDPCENSNDSGLGFDHHLEFQLATRTTLRFTDQELLWTNDHPEVKRKKLEIKLESDDANDNFTFSDTMQRVKKNNSDTAGLNPDSVSGVSSDSLQRVTAAMRSQTKPQPRPMAMAARRNLGPMSLASQLLGMSRDGKSHLQILCQPEQQHRARYQTEGSRGAVKDRSSNGFPVVKLVGYNKPATLQVFIGTDMGRVAPHMFYQACRVSGKNSTPCVEKRIDGTIVIEVDFDPAKDMVVTCDCVGILKERNVDVEHRFPDQSGSRNKKKSTRCRMVFRTTITHPDGSTEILQTTSQPIVCTQPPGIPEICKKSLTSCPCPGGMELFILGKNFLKDTRVVFQQSDTESGWEEAVQPDKEFLQQTHLVCMVPPYQRCDLVEPVNVRLFVVSSGKTSEPHTFTYTPAISPVLQPTVGTTDVSQTCSTLSKSSHVQPGVDQLNRVFAKSTLVPAAGVVLPESTTNLAAKPSIILSGLQGHFLPVDTTQCEEKEEVYPVKLWTSSTLLVDTHKQEESKSRECDHNMALSAKMMPPPPPLLPLPSRRASGVRLIIPDADPDAVACELKTELVDESRSTSQLSPDDLKGIDLRMKPVALVNPMATVADLSSTQSPSMATFRRFVSDSTGSPLPAQSAQSVEKYLSRLENPTSATKSIADDIAPTSTCSAIPATFQLALGKISCSAGVPNDGTLSTQFNPSSLLFSAPQQLTSNTSSTVADAQQKITYVNNVSLPIMFTSESSVELEKRQKSRFLEDSSLQEAITTRALLAASLNGIVPPNDQKSVFSEPALSVMCNSQSIPTSAMLSTGEAMPLCTESQLNTGQLSVNSFQSPVVSVTTEQASLNVPNIINTISEPSGIIQTAASLIFSSSQPVTTKTLLSNAGIKTDEQLLDKLSKSDNQQSPEMMTRLVGSVPHTQLLSPAVTASDTQRLNLQVPTVAIGQHLLADSSLMSVAPNTRLDILVSSALDTHILTPSHQLQAEKLDALVNSAAENHIINPCPIPISSENTLMNTQGSSVLLNNQNITGNLNATTPSIHVESMRLEPSSVNDFHLNSLNSNQPVQISQENIILNNAMSAALNEHILSSGNNNKVSTLSTEDVMLNTMGHQNLTVDTSAESPRTSPIMLLRSPTCTSPIAIKNMILNSPVSTSVDSQLLVTSPTHSSPIVMKNILNSSTVDTDIHLTGQNQTSPILMKSMILNSQSVNGDIHLTHPNSTSPITMNNMILSSTTVDNDIRLQNSNHTSPIAMKKLILDSSVSLVSDMHVSDPNRSSSLDLKEIILTPQVSGSNLLSTDKASCLSTESTKLNALAQSSFNSHILRTSSSQSSTPVTEDMRPTTSSSAVPLPLNTHSLCSLLASSNAPTLQRTSLIITQAPSLQSEGCITTSITPALVQNTRQESNSPPSLLCTHTQSTPSSLMDQQLTIFPATTTESNNQSLHFDSGNSSLETSCCTVTMVQVESLTNAAQFTTAASGNQSLLANATESTKLACLEAHSRRDGSTEFVNQVFIGLSPEGEIKNQLETPMITQISMPKAIQRSSEFLAPESKILEDRVFDTVSDLKSVGGSSMETNLPVIVTKLDVVKAVQQQQHRESSANTSVPVPVAEISSTTSSREVPTISGPVQQKKIEEGMVPQELTQMSDNDLLSYINPSCFDQV